MTTSQVQGTKQFFFTPSFEKQNSVEEFCDEINSLNTWNQEKEYQKLFDKDTSQAGLSSADRIRLVDNLLVIFQKIPNDLKLRLLKQFCACINKSIGIRTSAYDRLLNLIRSSLQNGITFEEFKLLSQCLLVIKYEIPDEIKDKSIIKNQILIIEQTFISILQNYYIDDNEVKQDLVLLYNLHFIPLNINLNKATSSSEILSIQENIRWVNEQLPNGLDLKLTAQVEKCAKFADEKILMRTFVENVQARRRSIYPILSIDGGGIRGIIPLIVLVVIETITKKPIASLFKLVGGTSTGGLLAFGLTKPDPDNPERPEYRAQDLLNLYTQDSGQIFRKNPNYQEDTSHLNWEQRMRETLRNPKYLSPTLFQERFGNSRMSSALTDVVITGNRFDAVVSKAASVALSALTGFVSFISGAFGNRTRTWSHESMPKAVHLFTNNGLKTFSYSINDLEGSKKYTIHHENEDDSLMADIAKITSAAPGFFPPVRLGEEEYMDGGVLQNNPAIPCIHEAEARGYKRKDMFMLSLGTGAEPEHAPKNSLAEMATSLWFETTQSQWEQELTVHDLLQIGASYRLQHRFTTLAPALDDTRPETIQRLQEIGWALVADNIDRIWEICKVLSPESSAYREH